MINVKNIRDLSPFKEGLNALKLFSDKKIEIIHITLAKDERIDSHKNIQDVVFYVLSGKGELIVENDKCHLKEGSCVEVKKDLDRSWKNTGDSSLCLMAIKKK